MKAPGLQLDWFFRVSLLLTLASVCWLPTQIFALVSTSDTGDWPKDWPKELEQFRKSARTIGVATGIQQNIYEIYFTNRTDFELVWPAILKLATPGTSNLPATSVTLYTTNHPPPKDWGTLLRNDKPAMRIYAPTYSYAGGPASDDAKTREDRLAQLKEQIRDGKMLKAGPPWPADIVATNGALPEFVHIKKVDSQWRWVPADLKNKDSSVGFYYRARIDFDLVTDGQIIDSKSIRLSPATPVRKIESGE